MSSPTPFETDPRGRRRRSDRLRLLGYVATVAVGLALGFALRTSGATREFTLKPLSNDPQVRQTGNDDQARRESPPIPGAAAVPDPESIPRTPEHLGEEPDLPSIPDFSPPGAEMLTGPAGAILGYNSFFFRKTKLLRPFDDDTDGDAKKAALWRSDEERKRLRHLYELVDEAGVDPLKTIKFQIFSELGGDTTNSMGRGFRIPASPEMSLAFYRDILNSSELSESEQELALLHLRRFEVEERAMIGAIVRRILSIASRKPPREDIAAFLVVEGKAFCVDRVTLESLGMPTLNESFERSLEHLNDLLPH